MSPTPLTVWTLAAVAVSSLVLPVGVVIAAMTVLVVASAADAWIVRRPPTVARSLPEMASRGVPAPIRVEPTQRRWRRLRIRQPVSSPYLSVSPPEQDQALVAELVASRRGRHRLGPAAVREVGPLGLGCWYHRTGDEAEVVVYPDLPAAHRLALSVRTGRFRDEGRRSRGPLGIGTELESIRDYQPDDDIRQVNWLATARTGSPMSNTYRVEQERDVMCLIDCGRLMSAPLELAGGITGTRLDLAVDVAAAVAAVCEELGDRMGVLAFSDRVLRVIQPGRKQSAAVLHAIHDLEPSPVDSDYETAFRSVLDMKRAFVLVLTDLLDEAAGRPLARAVPVITRRHALAVAGASDDEVLGAITTPADTLAEAAETTVALELLAGQRRLATRLRHAGAQVIEAPAPEFATRVVGAYLHAKRSGRM